MLLFLIEFLQFLLCNLRYKLMSKLNGLGKTYRKRVCSVSEKIARPFTTNKFFERIQILKEWKFHRLVQL